MNQKNKNYRVVVVRLCLTIDFTKSRPNCFIVDLEDYGVHGSKAVAKDKT